MVRSHSFSEHSFHLTMSLCGKSHRHHHSHVTRKVSQGHTAGQGQSHTGPEQILDQVPARWNPVLDWSQGSSLANSKLSSLLSKVHPKWTQTASLVQTNGKSLAPTDSLSTWVMAWVSRHQVDTWSHGNQLARVAVSKEMDFWTHQLS